jgi:uncharacterized protein (DUF1330 family)
MKLYAQEAPGSAIGHRVTTRAAYGRLRTTEGEAFEGAVILEFPTFEEAESWYYSPAYQAAVVHRSRGARFRTFTLQGVQGCKGSTDAQAQRGMNLARARRARSGRRAVRPGAAIRGGWPGRARRDIVRCVATTRMRSARERETNQAAGGWP